jgi:dihydrofolate reductase
MGRLSVVEFVTMDGVMQAPARPDEDTRDGFTLGGWAVPFADQVMGETMGARMSGDGGAFLLGRRTYLDFAAVWSGQSGNPSADVLNARHKYVVSSTLEEPLPWAGSSLVGGDVADAVAELKEDRDLGVLGSGELVRTLLAHGWSTSSCCPSTRSSSGPVAGSSPTTGPRPPSAWSTR